MRHIVLVITTGQLATSPKTVCKNRNWNVILDVHESIFIWICHFKFLKLHLFVYSMYVCMCMSVPCPRNQIQVLRLCDKYRYPWSNPIPRPSDVVVLISIFSSRRFSYLHLYHHLQLSNKVFLTGTSFLKHWLFTCPMKWKPPVLSLSALTSNFHALPYETWS